MTREEKLKKELENWFDEILEDQRNGKLGMSDKKESEFRSILFKHLLFSDRLTKIELEGALKDTLMYLDFYLKEAKEKGTEVDDWAHTIKDVLKSRLGNEHYGYAGWGFYGVFKCWLVIEIWNNGSIVPRCVSLTEGRADHVKDQLEEIYESMPKSDRPKISVEHQRMEHVFGFEMQESGRLKRTSDTFRPTETKKMGVFKPKTASEILRDRS